MGLSRWCPLLLVAAAFLLGGCTDSSSHSLRFFFTTVWDPDENRFHFSAVGYLDDQIYAYYNTDTRMAEPPLFWIKEFKKDYPHLWDRNTNIIRSSELRMKRNLKDIMNLYNQSRGIHTWQCMKGCELGKDGHKSGFVWYAYDGEDFLSFDKEALTWTAAVVPAQVLKRQWDADLIHSQSLKSYLEEECVDWLQKFLNYGNVSLSRRAAVVPAQVVKGPWQAASRDRCFLRGRRTIECLDWMHLLDYENNPQLRSAVVPTDLIGNQSHWSYLEKECIEWLQKVIDYENDSLSRIECPTVTVARKVSDDGLETLVCRAHGFYPKEIDATWRKDRQVWEQETFRGGVIPNSDGTYHTWLSVMIDPKDRDRYRCHVEHDGMSEPLDVAWEDPALLTALCILIVSMLIMEVLLGAGISIYIHIIVLPGILVIGPMVVLTCSHFIGVDMKNDMQHEEGVASMLMTLMCFMLFLPLNWILINCDTTSCAEEEIQSIHEIWLSILRIMITSIMEVLLLVIFVLGIMVVLVCYALIVVGIKKNDRPEKTLPELVLTMGLVAVNIELLLLSALLIYFRKRQRDYREAHREPSTTAKTLSMAIGNILAVGVLVADIHALLNIENANKEIVGPEQGLFKVWLVVAIVTVIVTVITAVLLMAKNFIYISATEALSMTTGNILAVGVLVADLHALLNIVNMKKEIVGPEQGLFKVWLVVAIVTVITAVLFMAKIFTCFRIMKTVGKDTLILLDILGLGVTVVAVCSLFIGGDKKTEDGRPDKTLCSEGFITMVVVVITEVLLGAGIFIYFRLWQRNHQVAHREPSRRDEWETQNERDPEGMESDEDMDAEV